MTEEGKLFPVTTVLLSLFVVVFIRFFLFDVLQVNGRSMEPKLKPGEIIVIGRFSYGLWLPFSEHYALLWRRPRRGDIVVVQSPEEDRRIVKRCVGVPGDTVEVRSGGLYVNGDRMGDATDDLSRLGPIPAGFIFVAGDNRVISVDSRSFGLVPLANLQGKVLRP